VLRRNRDAAAGRPFELDLATSTPMAGGRIEGELRGLQAAADVTLLRIEVCPAGRLATPLGSCRVEPHDGRGAFTLELSPETPPTAAGPKCRLGFAVRARSPLSGRRRAQVVLPVEVRGGERGLHEATHLYDRMLASFPARHFHVELADAVLEGGGWIKGRVHVNEGGDAGTVEVIARCEEAWRTNFRIRSLRQPPLWRIEPLWSTSVTVQCDPDRRWHPFAFTLPPELPAAVEGYVVSWRYEIEARRPAVIGPAERAVITPLRFDIA
jgi:hypothetical protein